MRTFLSHAVLCVALVLPARAAADDELRVNWALDGAVTGAGGALWILSETVLKKSLVPDGCRWCDDSLNGLDAGVRDALVLRNRDAPHQISNITGFVLTPVVAWGLLAGVSVDADRGDEWGANALIVLEASVAAALVNQVVKFTAARRRPFVRAGDFAPGADTSDHNLSFYSGHTAYSFAMAVASGTVASVRGYRGAPAIWAAGLTLAVTTGYLRIAADRHYFTDVLGGAVMGSAIGFAIPWFLHRNAPGDRAAPALSVSPSMVSLTIPW